MMRTNASMAGESELNGMQIDRRSRRIARTGT